MPVLAALAALFPWELGEKADPFASAPAGIKPEWYFAFMFQTLKYIPGRILGLDGELLGILFFGLLALLLVSVPFVTSEKKRAGRLGLLPFVGVAVLIYMLALTALALMRRFRSISADSCVSLTSFQRLRRISICASKAAPKI